MSKLKDRTKITLLILGIIILMALMALMLYGSNVVEVEPTPQPVVSSERIVLPPTADQVEAEINKWRTSEGLRMFNSEVPALDEAAQYRANAMCDENDWSHTKDWDILNQYYTYSFAGENLYYGSLRPSQEVDTVKAWVASPTHLENLKADYSQIGIGVKHCPGFQGNESAVIITNYFGVPR